MKYTEWFNIWLENYIKPSSKQRTYEQYCKIAKIHILPRLGNYELAELTPFVLQKFVTDLIVNGNKRTGKGLSPNFVKTIISVVQNSLKTAHLVGYLPEYMANKIKREDFLAEYAGNELNRNWVKKLAKSKNAAWANFAKKHEKDILKIQL